MKTLIDVLQSHKNDCEICFIWLNDHIILRGETVKELIDKTTVLMDYVKVDGVYYDNQFNTINFVLDKKHFKKMFGL